jgi:GTP-dependent phosphoenolpyruvate carboxykinase
MDTANKKRPKSPPPLTQQIYEENTTINSNPPEHMKSQSDQIQEPEEQEIPALTTQQEFVKAVKNWVTLDNQLRIFNERIKEAREAKAILTQQIYQYSEDNNFQSPSIEISDGELVICDKREYSSLTFSYIDKCLTKLIKEPAHVDKILHYLKENRESYVVPDIRRIYKTKTF